MDKFDYLRRDCESIGLKHKVEFNRLVSSAWVIGNSIAYDINEQESVFNLFQLWHSMFANVYYKEEVQAIELMLWDVFLES